MQLIRFFKEIGPLYSLMILLGFSLVIYLVYGLLEHPEKRLYVSGVSGFLILSYHLGRNDLAFLRSISSRSHYMVLVEYLLFLLPIWVLFALVGSILQIGLLLIGTSLISMIKLDLKAPGKRMYVFDILQPLGFEYVSFARKNPVIFIFLIVFLVGSLAIPYLVLANDFLFVLVIAGVYQDFESREMLEASELGPVRLMKNKSIRLFKLWSLAILPVNLLAALWLDLNPWAMIFFIVCSLLFSFYFLLTKYAFYYPGGETGPQNISSMLVIFGFFIPIFTLLGIFLGIRNYNKAMKNLNSYLHDFS